MQAAGDVGADLGEAVELAGVGLEEVLLRGIRGEHVNADRHQQQRTARGREPDHRPGGKGPHDEGDDHQGGRGAQRHRVATEPPQVNPEHVVGVERNRRRCPARGVSSAAGSLTAGEPSHGDDACGMGGARWGATLHLHCNAGCTGPSRGSRLPLLRDPANPLS